MAATEVQPGYSNTSSEETRELSSRLDTIVLGVNEAIRTLNEDVAAAANYEPAVATNWAGAPPETIADALDRIAAFINSATARPVPVP